MAPGLGETTTKIEGVRGSRRRSLLLYPAATECLAAGGQCGIGHHNLDAGPFLSPFSLSPPSFPCPPLPCSQIWMHTRCYNIPDEDPVPEDAFVCENCQAANKRQRSPP